MNHSSMGSSCSMQRHFDEYHHRRKNSQGKSDGSEDGVSRNALRHSVVCAIPDGSIAALYPVQDNYINVGHHLRSPKSLTDLCLDAVCRSLPEVQGALPPGLPQDVVDDVVASLMQHSALTATTLRVLRHCELGALSLAGCRGVTDAWLEPLKAEPMDLEPPDRRPSNVFYGSFEKWDDNSCSTSSFVSATEDHPPMDLALTCSQDEDEVDWVKDAPMATTTVVSSVTTNMTLLDIRGSHSLTDRGLMQLIPLASLQVAKLDHCHSLTGRGLLAFCHSHSLHTLSLANCRRLTDEAVINISHLSSLQALSLDGCRCLTDRSLAAMADLYRLVKLDLSQCDLITDQGLEQLGHLELLEELSLGWCRHVSDAGIDLLTRQRGRDRNLRVLRLARCSITDEGVRHLSRLLALEELDLNGCSNIGSSALGTTLEKLKHLTVLDVSYCPNIIRSSWQGKVNALKSLDLCYSGVKDSHMTKFMNLSSLEELHLDSCLVGDTAMAHLADHDVVPNLLSLDLADTNVTDLGMVKIAKFKKLTRLSLFYCNISNGGLRHLSKLSELQVLNLDSRDISDDGLAHLEKLTKLTSLDVFSGRITDAGCVHIAKIKSLESLELCGGGIGDLGCSLLASVDNLKCLNLSQNERITNRGAAALATLLNLKALNLSNTRVSSAALRFFSGLLKLQSLALYGCRGINDEIVLGKLRRGLPNLRCLRLNTSSDEDGMVLATNEDDELEDEVSIDPWNDIRSEITTMEDDATLYSDHD